MSNIQDDEPMVVGLVAGKPHTRTTRTGSNIRVIDTNVDGSIGVDQSLLLSCGLVDVCHVAMCRISSLVILAVSL